MDTGSPDDPAKTELTQAELERLRADMRRSIGRTKADLDRIELLIVAMQLRARTESPSPSAAGGVDAQASAEPRGAAPPTPRDDDDG